MVIKIVLYHDKDRPLDSSYVEHVRNHGTNFFYQRIVSHQRNIVYQYEDGDIDLRIPFKSSHS